ncbi:aromatic-ring-hydroxylating dioxygenase subunit beta [Amycolatopsis rubida]|uniref:Aromatic-ring-hydroxylating dioxygenase subunit beta n=1 Tax=Amycolatopsis rubida TaxID=112413 RepID=A0ABX0BRR4_9PSEU|nr:aromatic-ring-hydroxylating dioxygenase subunit beta [Amycolatopsis sp. M39]MYW92109.1 ring-hydroxylating dioxygenase subunit beta [Amycolatopsis rubida]NEC57095.1 aromatic-ring-hydroxylating dioxygenase subunit beta [Amycolatopsis rubida]OAP27725.1 2-halobenzoate 1,2-dioxygenase small subunit [Amycolatopsis sp. M39]
MSEIEQFLYAEAALLDARDFPGWRKLFADDAVYWIPANADDTDPDRDVSIVYDDVAFLAERVWRLDSGLAYAQEPRSRTVHLVSNVQVLRESHGEIDVAAAFLVVEFHRDVLHHHAGRYRYRLRRDGGELRIARKKAVLVNNGGHLGNLSVLL